MEKPNGEHKQASEFIVCAVYDSAVGAYLQPFYARSIAQAVRSFAQAATQSGHPFNDYPGDYTLFVVATWNEDTCVFESREAYERIGNGLELAQDPLQPSGQLDLVEKAG